MNPIRDYMSEVIVNVTKRTLWGSCKAICQRCDINLTRIHLLLEVLEPNSNLSEPVVLLKRMTSGVYSPGILTFIRWGVNYSLTITGLVLT